MNEYNNKDVQNIEKQTNSKKFICPICKRIYVYKEALYEHIYEKHSDELQEGMTAAHYVFNIRNHKTYGICVQCKKNKTKWNEDAERYDRFCSKECQDAYVKEFKERMKNKYGKEHLLNDPEIQMKMQDNRSIGGVYVFQTDKQPVRYLGSYEKDFLEYLDNVYEWKSTEVMKCEEVYEYEYNGKKHFYMPDYFLPNFNLIVEIKDGGDNPNNHPKIQEVDKVKESLKDEVMKNQTKRNYIKITNKEYGAFNFIIKSIRNMSLDDPDFKNKMTPMILIPEK